MPRDEMAASLIQRVARQARATFGSGSGEAPAELQRLRELLSQVSAEDLGLLQPRGPSAVPGPSQPPVSYMHICETARFSMGVFVLRAGACIPLHDHPGMQGLLKVLYGTLRIACLDAAEEPEEQPDAAASGAAAAAAAAASSSCSPRPRRLRALLRSHRLYTAAAPPCLLSPQRDNLHQIAAEEAAGPAAFLDILAPPYDPARGRDCHYYRLADGQSLPPPPAQPVPPSALWLLETPQAPDFWCGGEPYPGPRVWP
ncbi:2-aminoethanethiol dioxygenase-like [Pseudonaja textilis]|uniref:2-aminoethanethiol dioxygenase-like n=1 Tax=Pseudonaja textilis TaxID=8673 RepID=A0A670ZK82_PSETE|nr:2-aminoethanethiol dioxygenase-like [Pseudonaja textilis]XP_026580801.1 2-aminoethanethiol dioxygenase-like [Pseudonaja textilis]